MSAALGVSSRLGRRRLRLAPALRPLAGVASCAVGLLLVVQTLGD